MSLKGFFREAAVQPEHIKTVISRRFLDEEGNAIAWELPSGSGAGKCQNPGKLHFQKAL